MIKRIVKKYQLLLNQRQKRNVKILFVLMVVSAFLEVIGVSMMIPFLTVVMRPDTMEANRAGSFVCRILGIQSHTSFVLICIGGLIALFIFKNLFIIFQYYVQCRFVYNCRLAMQSELLDSYLHRSYEYFLYADSGAILRVIQKNVEMSYGLLLSMLGMASELIVSTALLITVFVISPFMTIGVVTVMFFTMLLILKVIKPILQKAGMELQEQYAYTNKWVMQSINGIKDVKVAGKEDFFLHSFESGARKLIQAEKKNGLFQNVPRLLIEMCCMCSMLGVIAVLVCTGTLVESLVPALGAFAMAAVKILPSANRITTSLNAIAYEEPALDALIENKRGMASCGGGGQKEFVKGSHARLKLESQIQFCNITYVYPQTKTYVLENADMTIPIGKSVGIVGASGSGKTTAVDIMLGLLQPESGQILADGVDIRVCYQEWLSNIGYIPQFIFMLDGTLRENVAFGDDNVQDERIWGALKEAQLDEFVHGLDAGLDTEIGEHGIRLSGGQRQRIGIARALYSNPNVLIFDEATSALDNETEAAIMESINALHGKKTMIIIAHRLSTIKECDLVYRVKNRKITLERNVGDSSKTW